MSKVMRRNTLFRGRFDLKKLALLGSVLVMLIAVSACSSGSPEKVSVRQDEKTASGPLIAVSYIPLFTGQTAAGYLSLVIEITVENRGYKLFNLNPDDFSVQVKDYLYPAREKELEALELQNGDRVSGRLLFQVPAEAATTRVGYRVIYTGRSDYDIRWLRESGAPAAVETSEPEVTITHYSSYMWVRETRSLYQLVKMTIENRGYESFNTSPQYFSLVIGNIFGDTREKTIYSFDGALSDSRDGAYSDLRAYDLQNGGRLTGTLAFQVPTGVLAGTRGYELEYSGLRSYNLKWIKVSPPEQE